MSQTGNNDSKAILLIIFLLGGFVVSTGSSNPIVSEGLENMSLTTLDTQIIKGGSQFYLVSTAADRNEWLYGYFTTSDVATIKAAGGNTVEIHTINFLNDIMPTKNVINTDFFTNTLDGLVTAVTSQGLYCIINQQDLTTWSLGSPYIPEWMLDGHGYGSAPYSVATQKQAFKDFINVTDSNHDDNRLIWMNTWAWIADRYKSNPYVIFSLMNEPMNGAGFSGAEYATWCGYYASFIEDTIDIIRATGASNLIFVDKPYSANLWSDIVDVDRADVVWEDHCYVTNTNNYATWQGIIDDMVDTYVDGFGKPLFVGEYATIPLKRTNWQTDLTDMTTYLNDKTKFSGRSFHSWGMLYGEYNSAINDPTALASTTENDILTRIVFGAVKPIFNPPAGTYGATQNVVISSDTSGATIYYTDDGSTPDAGDIEYNVPVEVAADVILKAIAIKAGLSDSDISTAVYAINLPPSVSALIVVKANLSHLMRG